MKPEQSVRRYAVKDLEWLPDNDKPRDLVDGALLEWPGATLAHGAVVAMLGMSLFEHVSRHRLGRAVIGATVKIANSDCDARTADLAFYPVSRLPKDLNAFATTTVPDLVVDVLTPFDRADWVLAKIHDWRRAGVPLLWYVDPQTGGTTVYHAGQVTYVARDESLTGRDVLPGFSVRIGDLLSEISQPD